MAIKRGASTDRVGSYFVSFDIRKKMGKGYIKGSRPMLTVDHIGKAV